MQSIDDGLTCSECALLCVQFQTELISGDQNGNIRVWDLTANSCSCELVGVQFSVFPCIFAVAGAS
jgi:hypothetical protein